MDNKYSAQRYSSRDLYSSSKRQPSNKLLNFFNRKSGKVILVIFSVIFLLSGTGLIGMNYYLSKINYTPQSDFGLVSSQIGDEKDDISGPTNNNPDAMQFGTGNILSNPNIQNILLIGSDTRGNEQYGRSDSMMIMSINKSTKQVKVTSLMRDMYVKIPGFQDNRINVAYANGGPKLLIETIQDNFRVKIDNYVRVNFSSFQKLIDLVGGVQITLTQAEAKELNNHYSTYFGEASTKQTGSRVTFRAGTMTLNGTCALAYSRIRHIDSDFGRTQRQRNVLTSLMSSVKHSNILTIMNVANEILPLIQTDIPRDQILGFANDATALTSQTLQQCHLPADNAYKSESIRGMSVLVPNVEANKKVLWKFIYNYAG